MVKRALWIGMAVLLLSLPLTALAANVPAKIFENGANNTPVAVSGVKVEVFGGYGFKGLLSSGVSGSDGSSILSNVPFGKEVVVKLTKADYITQYDVRSYSEADAEKGVALWIGSETNVKALYKNLVEAFDVKKGQVYLEINDELTGEGIEGVQIAPSSGKAFDLGQGDYLIVNAAGNSVKIAIAKPGYAFDIESTTVPLFAGAMTQYYISLQSGGAVYSPQAAPTSISICGTIKTLSGAALVPLSGVSVAFTFINRTIAAPTATTDKNGLYCQKVPVRKIVKVIPVVKSPIVKFKPNSKLVFVPPAGKTGLDFEALK